MTREDLVGFARRDWAAIDDQKAAYWVDRKRSLSPAEVLRIGDELRRQASVVRPDYPGEADRAADHATHERVTGALRAVTRTSAG
jgi:hypothetical protein